MTEYFAITWDCGRGPTAVKRMWHTQDSQGQIIALALQTNPENLHALPSLTRSSEPRCHARPFECYHLCPFESWSHLRVLGTTVWACIAKSGPRPKVGLVPGVARGGGPAPPCTPGCAPISTSAPARDPVRYTKTHIFSLSHTHTISLAHTHTHTRSLSLARSRWH